MSDAVFGPGWPDRLGDLVWSLADELPEDASERLRKTALLPPDDPRWGAAVEGRDELLNRLGVVDGLRLQNVPEVRFRMTSSFYELPGKPPPGTPQAAWDAWREAVREAAKPYYESSFEYAQPVRRQSGGARRLTDFGALMYWSARPSLFSWLTTTSLPKASQRHSGCLAMCWPCGGCGRTRASRPQPRWCWTDKTSSRICGSYWERSTVTRNRHQKQIEVAMERAEIDAQALADVRHRWAGDISLLVDRIRPVLALLGVPDDGLDAAAANIEHLAEWLSSNLQQWAAPEVLSAARQSRDDHAMGVAAWRALGDVAQLPKWNETLGVLGDRYVAVENRRAGEQTAAYLEAATPLLRGFARYVAVDAGNPDLFGKIEAVSQSFKGHKDWPTRWWEVPFGTIIDELRAGYAKIPVTGHHLEVLEGANTVDDLRAVFQRRNIATDRDPYDTASLNKKGLDEVLRHVHDLRRAWMDLRASEPIVPGSPEPSAEFDAAAYLSLWSDDELLARALCVIDDAEFVSACNGCKSLNEIRERLGLDPEVIDARRQERLRGEREAERQRRTFNVADASFEVGTTSYRELFERLNSLAGPEGPRASKDAFTPLTIVRPSSGGSGGGSKGGKTSHLRHSAELRDLVGIVGEMHAYRFLRAEFGNDVVTRDAWVSEIRLKVLTPVVGEPDTTSDGLGFDFRFRYCGKRWHVEVKATRGDDPQFDLGISEIEAASRLAQVQGELWRILRVRNALSVKPEFDWLPNPFKEDARRYFRLHKGGMIVSYTRKKT